MWPWTSQVYLSFLICKTKVIIPVIVIRLLQSINELISLKPAGLEEASCMSSWLGLGSQFVLPAQSVLKHRSDCPTLLLYTPQWLPFAFVLKSKHLVGLPRHPRLALSTSPAHFSPSLSFFPRASHFHSSPMEPAASFLNVPCSFNPLPLYLPFLLLRLPFPHLFTRETPTASPA